MKVKKMYPDISNNYINQVWYKVRDVRSQVNRTPSNNLPVPQPVSQPSQNDESSDESVITPEINVEKGDDTPSVGLKDIYGKMFEEEGGGEESSDDSNNSSDSSGGDEGERFNNNNIHISPATFLTSIAKGINNGILYGGKKLVGERELSDDEISIINSFSEVVAKKDLSLLEDQPELNYVIASFLVPAANRLDLYYDKVVEMIKKRDNKQRQQQRQQTQSTEKESGEVIVTSRYSPEQQDTIDRWIAQGFKVDPNYVFTDGIDIVAYRDLRIVRNLGSGYS